jgi:hypothetical protein
MFAYYETILTNTVRRKVYTVEDVCAPLKSITAKDLPAGVAVRALNSHAEGPVSNPAQDKNFH